MAQYSTKMIFAVLDGSLIMGLNIGETDKVFFTLTDRMSDRCQCQTWYNVSNVLDKVDVCFSRVTTPHGRQHATTATLSWQVNVTTDVGRVTDHIQQLDTQRHTSWI